MCDTVLCYASDLRTCKSTVQSDDRMTCIDGDANVLHGSEWCIIYLQEGTVSKT